MAITWGSEVENSSGNGMRVGYEFSQSPASVGAGTGSVTVTVRLYVWTRAPVFDSNNNFSWSGSFGSGSGSVNISHGSGGGTTLARTMSRNVSTSFAGTVSSSVSASLNGVAPIGGTAGVSGSHTTARRPFSPPRAPSGMSSTRSGSSITTRWKNNPTTGQPYSNVRVRRSVSGADFADVANLSGGSTSFTQSGLPANSWIRYAIRAENSAGDSSWVYGPTISIPAGLPAAPTDATVARNSDTSHTVRWDNTNPGSSTAPYEKIQVQRWTLTGGNYVTVATLSGAPTSYTDRSTVANQQYRYRVIAHNGGGASGAAYTPYISTTPAPPDSLKATKNSAGDITLTWSNLPNTKHTGIEVWLTESGVDRTSRQVLLGPNSTSWTHSSPLASSTWSYRVKAVVGPTASTETGPTLYSSFSGRSNTVQLLTNPLAPTGLSPSSQVRDGDDAITMTWVHNEVDGTDQTAFQVAHRIQGESAWNYTGKIVSGLSRYVLPAGTYANGEVIEWRVCTWGLYVSSSPFSASALITLSTPPSVTIMLPQDGAIIGGTQSGVSWSFYDAEGNAQSQWRAKLIDETGETVENRSGTGTASSLSKFNSRLSDGGTYTIQVEVRDSTGLWSPPDTVTITAQYPLPSVPQVVAEWDPETGAVIVSITNPAAGDGEIEPVSNDLWRSINGEDWVMIGTGIELDSNVTDYLPGLNSENYYKAVAVSDLPSTVESDPFSVNTSETHYWVWLNAGPAFSVVARIRDNATLGVTSGRHKTLKVFAGRPYPVEFSGEQLSRELTLSARFAPESSTPADIEFLAQLPAPACIRMPDGQRYFVSVGSPNISYAGVTKELTLALTQVDYHE